MSLLDALLLDPVRINVWIACRTDGIAGSGTQNDPYDGSSLAKFDEIMRKLSEDEEPICVHLGPGTFLTAGYYDGQAEEVEGWQAQPGIRYSDFFRNSAFGFRNYFLGAWLLVLGHF